VDTGVHVEAARVVVPRRLVVPGLADYLWQTIRAGDFGQKAGVLDARVAAGVPVAHLVHGMRVLGFDDVFEGDQACVVGVRFGNGRRRNVSGVRCRESGGAAAAAAVMGRSPGTVRRRAL
jgi:hypothetical protein